MHFTNPKICSLGGGLPLPDLFPYDKVSAKALAAPFNEGIDKDILEAKDTIDIEVYKKDVEEFDDINLSISLQYGQSHGNVLLREYIKEHTRRVHHVGYDDWDVVLTIGNTYGLDATVRTFVNPGEPVLVEEFSFSSALECMRANGAIPVGVKMDLDGIIPEVLETQLANWVGPKPKYLYTIPTGQNPTGSTLSPERRQAIYKIAQKYDFLIVEDEPYYYLQMPVYEKGAKHEQHLDREGLIKSLAPSFLDYDVDGRVVRLDSFSKVLAPGTRIGWIVANKMFLERYLRLLESTCQVPSGFSQSLVYGLLTRWGQDGYLDWLIKLREFYTKKRDVTCDAIYQELPAGKYELVPPTSGMFFWLKIDARRFKDYEKYNGDAKAIEMKLYELGVENGVFLVPGHWFFAPDNTDPPQPRAVEESEDDKNAMFFRGTFASVPDDKLVLAIQRWAKTMNEYLK